MQQPRARALSLTSSSHARDTLIVNGLAGAFLGFVAGAMLFAVLSNPLAYAVGTAAGIAIGLGLSLR